MQTQNPILCITIPSYNRESHLKKLLESIITQEGFGEDVSIVINDGPSTDNTTKMVAEFQQKYNNIIYTQNKKAVGMLPAILESINMSNGKYTWLFGSDDFMHKDALKITLDIIKNNSPTLILSNRTIFENPKDLEIKDTQEVKTLFFKGFSDFWIYLWMSEEEKYSDKQNYLTFMSVFCFDTQYYKESLQYVNKSVCKITDLEKHYFNYIVVLFSRLFVTKIICIIESPRLVFCQSGNTSRQRNNKINKDWKMLMDYLQGTYPISQNCKKLFRRIHLESFIFWNCDFDGISV